MQMAIEIQHDLSALLHVDLGMYCLVAQQVRDREWVLGRISSDSRLDELNLKGRNGIILHNDKLYIITKHSSKFIEIIENSKNAEAVHFIQSRCGGAFNVAEKDEQEVIQGLTGSPESIYDHIPEEMMVALRMQLGKRGEHVSEGISYRDSFVLLRHEMIDNLMGLTGELAWNDLKRGLISQWHALGAIKGPKQASYEKLAVALEQKVDDEPLCIQVLDRTFIELVKNSIDALITHRVVLHEFHGIDTVEIKVLCELEDDEMIVKISDDAGGFLESYIEKFNRRAHDPAYRLIDHKSDTIKNGPDKKFYCGGNGFGLEVTRQSIPDMSIENSELNGKRGAQIILKSPCQRPQRDTPRAKIRKKDSPDSGIGISVGFYGRGLIDHESVQYKQPSTKEWGTDKNTLLERRKKKAILSMAAEPQAIQFKK